MKQLILNIKDESKVQILVDLIKELDFVELKTTKKEKKHSIFDNIGMWEGRDIDGEKLRREAWGRNS